MPKYFTVEEANQILPQLRDKLNKLQDRKRRLDRKRLELAELQARIQGNGHDIDMQNLEKIHDELDKLVKQLNRGIGDIHFLGCELKDIDMGLIDFHALREGREVYLCWRLGEEDVSYWHELETGYTGRQPL